METPTPSFPAHSGQNEPGEFDNFTNFLRKLVAVPHSEIKAQLDAEKKAKRTAKAKRAYRAAAASSKKAD